MVITKCDTSLFVLLNFTVGVGKWFFLDINGIIVFIFNICENVIRFLALLMYIHLRFTPVSLLEQLHSADATNFCANSFWDLTDSCVFSELLVHAACLGMSLVALQGCRKSAGFVLLWYKGLSLVQQICVAFKFQDTLSASKKHCLLRIVIICKIVQILSC